MLNELNNGTDYDKVLDVEVLQGYLSNDAFRARVQQLSDLTSKYVEKDPTAFYTYEQYQAEAAKLL
ncbi:hypothetical protein [Paenibacillus thalictri]|uniref:Uncharacterized protein n=1 Tax=Paenibacillus thalictri TaxID=2527873 RepID=A0A4Q9DDY9_9BACL|nr:hypothetical protein [Paenibacillus thalictri]TBL69410.1 hypothetical protein EYB31_36085 [Paenibacillus thalictri]